MSSEKYYVLSESGFGGPLYRVARRYINMGENVEVNRASLQASSNVNVALTTIESQRGKILDVSARSTKKIGIALIQPTDETDFINYLETRNPESGKINVTEIPTTDLSPLDFVLSMLSKVVATELSKSNLDIFQEVITRESVFPAQNIGKIIDRAQKCLDENRVFRFACFACLNIKCVARNNLPVYFIGQEENRLETPRLFRKTLALVTALSNTGIPYSLDFLLTDNDPYEIYGEWLTSSDQQPTISSYAARLQQKLERISPSISLKLWSDTQSPYQDQYTNGFKYAYTNLGDLIGEEYIQRSIDRRLDYFSQLGIQPNLEIRQICDTTARRNVSLYAAQGPILNQEYDCLIIADPDPLRLGKIQSLLTPDLPIWYPYSG